MGFLFELFRKKPAVEAAPPGFRRIEVVRMWHERTPHHVRVLELELDGDVLWSGWARPGKRLEEREAKQYPSAAAAKQTFDDRERNFGQHERSYRDVPESRWKDGAPSASDPVQEAAIDATPDDAGLARVYTDWLVGQGDPRGELFALAAERRFDDVEQFFEVNGKVLRGPLELSLGSALTKLEWESGLLVGAQLMLRLDRAPPSLPELTKSFLALPLTRFVTALRFGLAGYFGDNDWSETLKVVSESPRAAFSAIAQVRRFHPRAERTLVDALR